MFHERTLYNQCPICQSTNYSLFKSVDCTLHSLYSRKLPSVINWQNCECGHEFTDGYFKEEAEKELLSKVYSYQILNPVILEKERPLAGKIVSNISQYINKGRWLDVGFGNGTLLAVAEEFGFTPVGVDLRPEAVNLLPYEAYCEDFLDHTQDKYSVLSLSDVLEHLPYPLKAIEKAYNLLLPNGILFISCPNRDSYLWKILEEQNPYMTEIEHYHNFGKDQLYKILEQNRLKPFDYNISLRYRIGMEILARKYE